MSDWRETDINVDSLWFFGERDKSGKHENAYHGNFVPQIPRQLLKRYTKEGDVALDLFMGSGTTLFECENLGRRFIGFDINEAILDFVRKKMAGSDESKFCINLCDATKKADFDKKIGENLAKFGCKKVDFLIAHPPYLDIVKFTQKAEDLSQISDVVVFIEKFLQAMRNGLNWLAAGKYFAVVCGDIYKKSEVVPLAFLLMNAVKQNFSVKMKGIVVKNIEGNRGKLGAQNIWKYRALKSDYFLFKHEYIFVFKKERD